MITSNSHHRIVFGVGLALLLQTAGLAQNAEQAKPADPFLDKLDLAIEVTSRRYLTANVHTPWQIMHGIVALRQEFMLKLGDEKVSAIEWIATNDPHFDGVHWIELTANGGKFHSFTRPYAFEGHPTQFLALLSMSGLPREFEFKVGPRTVTIADMLETAKYECNTAEEMTWNLWAFTNYLPLDAKWTNKYGEQWSIGFLVQLQNRAEVTKSACGGNHNLFALAFVRNKYLEEGRRLRGVWLEADQKVKRYIEVARSLQNSDGTFSADFYKGPKYSRDFNERLNTTGHTLEFLAVALPDNRLHEPWVRNAVWRLSIDLTENRKQPADCGPLYHSLHALRLYRKRIVPEEPAQEVAADDLAELPPSVEPLLPQPQAGETATGDSSSTAVEFKLPLLKPAAPSRQ